MPVCTRGYEMENERVVVLVPKFENKIYHIFSDKLKQLFFRISLDELGTATWKAIDGVRSVREISKHIMEHTTDSDTKLEELDERLSKYMTMLYERRFITFKQIMDD